MNNVLPCTACNLQHNALSGQNARKDIEYRAFVALRCGNEPFPVGLLFAALPKHRSSVKAGLIWNVVPGMLERSTHGCNDPCVPDAGGCRKWYFRGMVWIDGR